MARRNSMATNIAELPTAEDEAPVKDEAPAQDESKRKRVDIDALAKSEPHAKVTLSLGLPAEMRVQLRSHIESNSETKEMSENAYVLGLIASNIGYEIPASFLERKRRTDTANMTEEERKEHAKRATAEKRENVNAILAKITGDTNDPLVQQLLAQLGVDPSKLPKPRLAKDGEQE